jgi:hypothetical protein
LPKNCPDCGSDDPKRWDHENVGDGTIGCRNPWHEAWHQITEWADGPDLDDLVRLIRYCREHGVTLSSGQTSLLASEMERPCPVILRLYGRTESTVIVEGEPLPEAHFVGPDGTVYDNERNPL